MNIRRNTLRYCEIRVRVTFPLFGCGESDRPSVRLRWCHHRAQRLDHFPRLRNNYFRDYEPAIGRYVQADPIGIDGGLNLYAYVGGKDRVVPLGQSVCDLVKSYLVGIRPEWVNAGRDKHLFLNRWGNGMDPQAVAQVVHKHAKRAGIEKPVSTHSFRHSCATHMLRNGAPIRQLQKMLGHASLETTQVYTRVTINDLRAMHSKFHPREQTDDSE